MVSTVQIKPALILQPFVSCYALRIFNTGEMALPRPMHAVQECYMTFFLKDKFCDFITDSGEKKGKLSNTLCTLFTRPQGCTYWKGNYVVFSVQFKSNGVFAIFGITQKTLINALIPAYDIWGNENSLLTEQLEGSKDIYEMGMYMNASLTGKLLRQKHTNYTSIIAGVSNIISKNKGVVSLDRLALHANMSFRNFERRFVDEVGMPPKLYARITRFYNALENKMLHPSKTWTDITYENGYFDQAHFIKEVKTFSSKTPDELFKDTPPPTEDFITKVDR
jgi:AraC-like DNA-binding protein